jgi:hypothetical protein
MWPWQLKKLPKRALFFFKLSGVSVLLHLIFLLILVCIQGFGQKPLHFSFHTGSLSQTPVVFLPLYKRVHKDQFVMSAVNKKTSSSMAAKKPAQSSHHKIVKQVSAPNKSVPAQKTTTIASSSKQTSKPTVRKSAEKVVGKQNQITKSQKKIEQKKQGQSVTNSQEQSLPEQSQIFIGREELALLQMQAAIEQEISTIWKPPYGLSKDLTCEIMAIIGTDGKALKTTVQKSSGVLIYDVAARTALAKVSMPSWAHGKEICITFKQ